MDHCDVLIVGGGPAGSTLAWKLRKHGLDVVILDKSTFPRHKVCAGWITPAVTELLAMDMSEYQRGRVLQEISGFRTSLIGGPEVVTRYGSTVSYGIRRSEFDHYLLLRSKARLLLGTPVTSIKRINSSWLINDTVKTPLVIGAGGHFCPVSRLLRRDRPWREQAVIAQECEFELDQAQQRDCQVAGDTAELYFCEDLKGYGWCFRKGNYLNIGLGREDNRNVAEQVKSFVGYLKERKRIPQETPDDFKGHAYMLYSASSQPIADNGVMLIGDAAGLAHPKSGEGIRPAIESALIAADLIVSAFGDYQREILLRYPVLLAQRLGKDIRSPGLLPASMRRMLSRKLMANKWFAKNILLDRWFLNSRAGASTEATKRAA